MRSYAWEEFWDVIWSDSMGNPYKHNTFIVIMVIGISEKLRSFLMYLGLSLDSVRHEITK